MLESKSRRWRRAPTVDFNIPLSPSHAKELRRLKRAQTARGWLDLGIVEERWKLVPVSAKVPTMIAQRIDIAKDIFRYSHFRSGLADAAYAYILVAYEAALQDTYRSDKPTTLALLLPSAQEAGLIPNRFSERKLANLKQKRDGMLHGRCYLGGSVQQDWLLEVIDLINCVFEPNCRATPPPFYVEQMLQTGRNERLMAGCTTDGKVKPQPGDYIVPVGTEDRYEPGTYICIKCGREHVQKVQTPELALCRNRKCLGTCFIYRPAPIS